MVLLWLVVNFVRGLTLELTYTSLIVNILSGLTHLHGFQLLFFVAVAHRNNVFCLYQRNKSSSGSKVNFKQASIVLAVVKLASKAKESITSQKLGYRDI